MLQRAHTLARCTATLLVALWACQPLGALLHAKEAHAHRFCPQHQAFEETASGTGTGLSRLAAQRGPQLTTLPEAGSDSARLTHEDCPLLTSSSRDELLASRHESLALKQLAVSRPATAPPRASPPLPVLATAPKASPPARG
ncbi:hypothetical protein [Pyxidicoccus xibeiensis]|uniref:hypothetical protein n=1 Tax=Pyxidicoccus xibeiensis TaxID=2906759 RepID=UPI0020A6E013|nr:hypothetical protein [Pyxidicoccus xibeiensis]MCP3142559.1 hypothetical protein [Pyxidicoccus xibeiensis]